MDSIDRKILALLQQDASVSVTDIANQVGLSTTPCWRRIQRLEDCGVISRRVALLDLRMLQQQTIKTAIAVGAANRKVAESA